MGRFVTRPRNWNSPPPSLVARSEWTQCSKATRAFDMDMVSSLRGDMDTLLVFASLFSAVVTAFVIDSYHGLRGASSADPTAAVLQQLLLHMKEETQLTATASSTSSATSTSSVCINALWFSSLVLSLNSVLGAILAKQWLSEYEAVTFSTSASPRKQAALRQLKFDSLGRWRVTTIIGYLPVQLICALFLFFAGLVYLVWTLNATVAIITSVWVGISAFGFVATTLLPSFYGLCAFCSPQSWFFFCLSNWRYSLTDTWTDTYLRILSHASESRMYEARALSWVHATPELLGTVICEFRIRESSPRLDIVDRMDHAKELWNAIGPAAYWRVYTTLLEPFLSKNDHFSSFDEDEEPLFMVFCSLHLVLCQEPSIAVTPQILLTGLTQLARISLTFPTDEVGRSLTAILSHISSQEHLPLPLIDEKSITLLDSFTAELVRDASVTFFPSHRAFPYLSPLCIRLWCRTSVHIRAQEIDLHHLTALLSAMQSIVGTASSFVSPTIAHWIFALDDEFIQAIVDRDDKDVLCALQELVLSFRKAHDGGIVLAKSIVERIDVLIVNICSPEVVCATISSSKYSGTNDHFSAANIRWWAEKLGQNRTRIFRLLCDQFPLLNPQLEAPTPSQTAHVQIICEAARFWPNPWGDCFVSRALHLVVSCCSLSKSDLSLWFPHTASPEVFLADVLRCIVKSVLETSDKLDNPEDISAFAQVMRCAVKKLPEGVGDDPALFISLISCSLDLAALCISEPPDADLVAAFHNLLDTAGVFARFDAHKQAHSGTIRRWLVKLSRLAQSPLLDSPQCARALIDAARDVYGNTIEGVDDVETLAQLTHWADHCPSIGSPSSSGGRRRVRTYLGRLRGGRVSKGAEKKEKGPGGFFSRVNNMYANDMYSTIL
ncbi:hypothetical protein MVEN_00326400 [Mycena venus]|uniref:DUF6535 domain-containing protein n=1 Tax=Mycena venus TaxID=2733690 RepID=A0A8H6YSW5_9AGAR|nr:hypothetical protein MVEN_00326400 [Mycena venus]